MQLLCAADLERELFILRKLIEKEKNEKMSDCKDDFYICTFSNNTIVYKVAAAVPLTKCLVRVPARLRVPRVTCWEAFLRAVLCCCRVSCQVFCSLSPGSCAEGLMCWKITFSGLAGTLNTAQSRSCLLQGMLRSQAVGEFFQDLTNSEYTTAFAVYHRRYSTNTTPRWPLAQPMRFLGHNGGSF